MRKFFILCCLANLLIALVTILSGIYCVLLSAIRLGREDKIIHSSIGVTSAGFESFCRWVCGLWVAPTIGALLAYGLILSLVILYYDHKAIGQMCSRFADKLTSVIPKIIAS